MQFLGSSRLLGLRVTGTGLSLEQSQMQLPDHSLSWVWGGRQGAEGPRRRPVPLERQGSWKEPRHILAIIVYRCGTNPLKLVISGLRGI